MTTPRRRLVRAEEVAVLAEERDLLELEEVGDGLELGRQHGPVGVVQRLAPLAEELQTISLIAY